VILWPKVAITEPIPLGVLGEGSQISGKMHENADEWMPLWGGIGENKNALQANSKGIFIICTSILYQNNNIIKR